MKSNNLNVRFPINQLSYGIAGNNILHALAQRKQVALFPIGNINAEQKYHACIQQCLSNAQLCDYNAPCIVLFHQNLLAETVGRGAKIGFPIFELDTFNQVEKHHLSNQDILFVTSKWGKEIISQNNIQVPTYVIPLGVDRSIFHPNIPRQHNNKTIFFHCSKIEIRKGHEFLPQLFESIKHQDNWELWISWFNHFLTKEEIEKWESYYRGQLGDRVKFLPWVQSQQELANIMAQTDIGLWPSLGEGWLFPALEYMSLSKPVITTNYSAPTEYCNNTNSYLITGTEKESAYDGRWFFNQGLWFKYNQAQIEQAQSYVQALHKKRQEEGYLTNQRGAETAEKFSWANSADRIVEVLDERGL